MIRPALTMALLIAATPAPAADDRIRTLFYDPAAVITVAGRAGIQSTIEFGPDERIENVAVGDSSAWQVTPNRRASLLFVKPISGAARTNMTVVTDRRTYMFDLIARPRTAVPLYVLRFTYPEPPAPPAPKVETPLVAVSRPSVPLSLNFDWAGKGDKALLPRRAFDDGRALYLAWDKTADLPAMLALDGQGHEGPVNYSIKGDYVVIDQLPAMLVLRAGRATATLRRSALSATPSPARSAAR